jgi:hypothetical protein
LGGGARQGTLRAKAEQQLGKGLFRRGEGTETRRQLLCHQLSELAELEQARVWVVFEVTLRQHAQPDQLHVVALKEIEVAPSGRHNTQQSLRTGV